MNAATVPSSPASSSCSSRPRVASSPCPLGPPRHRPRRRRPRPRRCAPYTRGRRRPPGSINPLTARTAADRDLVALVFSGLVRLGPDGTIVPRPCRALDGRRDGRSLDVQLRPDARWHDGVPLTADDVVFTFSALQRPDLRRARRRDPGARSRPPPSTRGPSASTWRRPWAVSSRRRPSRSRRPISRRRPARAARRRPVGPGPGRHRPVPPRRAR